MNQQRKGPPTLLALRDSTLSVTAKEDRNKAKMPARPKHREKQRSRYESTEAKLVHDYGVTVITYDFVHFRDAKYT